jgi:hypothetical protein
LKILNAACLSLALSALVAAPAQAQMMTWTDQGFVNVTVGGQAGSRTLGSESTFDLYGEQGRLSTTQEVGGGGLFDISAGYKVWRNLAIGLGYSRTGSDSDAAIAASVPDLNVFDAPRAVTGTASGTDHSESTIYITGTWMMPVTDKIDVGLSFGPAIFNVGQDVPSAITVTEPSAAISETTVSRFDETTMGISLGVDVTYLVTPRYGAGVLLRYTRGSVDIEGANDSLTVGGFQIGAGLRVRF